MGKSILAGEPLSHNDLSVLRYILEHSFDFYLNQDPPFPDYLQALRILIGLGFAAAFVDKHLLDFAQSCLSKCDKLAEQGKTKALAQAVAELIHIASLCFYMLKFPGFYQDFVAALRSLLKIPGFDGQKEAEELLARFLIS